MSGSNNATSNQISALQIVVSALCSSHKNDERFHEMVRVVLEGMAANLPPEEAESLRKSVKILVGS
ncbi:hypothetical protein CXF96_16655 [Stenotrophomonas sp. Betaine-02u-21]|uniref:hypothetical protein n=1 Tax=unclassified Stenotrophomonas TaxID=196198 RepID=UPI000C34FC5E|nr:MULTISPECIES: hypothetical protein [unclassified Stenotrophomonas]PKH71817.1 hypothetical protein CXF96_16655 [Stenotrophomonas sp. Betaine-02u-21]PKH74941.1 hypothetical protein CXF90_03955 [Stenotrophomonas sp. Betaine-02u-23]PKH95889.1 hypothetical protein CXG43_11740 [Stenotrophomonas sp. Bg11-02]